MDEKETPHVVIVGAGFAGLAAARTLRKAKARVTVIDRNNYHTFLPLLYQVGAAEIEPEQIAYPVRSVFRGSRRTRFIRGEVDEIRTGESVVRCGDTTIPYDYLIIASGSTAAYFGVPGAREAAFTLKSLEDAMVLRNHILVCFERAARVEDPEERRKLLSFVIIGGGPTGVEYAGALAELVNGPLAKDFPTISPKDASIKLIEASPRILSMFKESSSEYAERKLERMGVEVVTQTPVRAIGLDCVTLDEGTFSASTVLWTAGVRGSVPRADLSAESSDSGRVKVEPTLLASGHDNVLVAGDLADCEHDGASLPMLAPVATQQGAHAAKNVERLIAGRPPTPFEYRDKGFMATIGRSAAVTHFGGFETRGFVAWVLWLFVHILYLIGFRNRLFVLVNWVWSYLLFDRAVRLIMPGCCEDPGDGSCRRRRCAEHPKGLVELETAAVRAKQKERRS